MGVKHLQTQFYCKCLLLNPEKPYTLPDLLGTGAKPSGLVVRRLEDAWPCRICVSIYFIGHCYVILQLQHVDETFFFQKHL